MKYIKSTKQPLPAAASDAQATLLNVLHTAVCLLGALFAKYATEILSPESVLCVLHLLLFSGNLDRAVSIDTRACSCFWIVLVAYSRR